MRLDAKRTAEEKLADSLEPGIHGFRSAQGAADLAREAIAHARNLRAIIDAFRGNPEKDGMLVSEVIRMTKEADDWLDGGGK